MSPDLLSRCGYAPTDPVLVAVQRGDGDPEVFAQGATRMGDPLGLDTLVYAASLSKQLVGACTAVLVRDDRLDVSAPLSLHVPVLPGWADDIHVRHLLHHTSGLPEDIELPQDQDRTTDGVFAALRALPAPPTAPGVEFRYSNPGYVCLGAVLERVGGRPLPALARELLFLPLGMTRSQFWAGPEPAPPGAAPLREPHPAPLSLGDGGAWSTPRDLLRWSRAMNADRLGVSALTQHPGHLDDGTPLDYGWGVGVREHAGLRVYRHGGGWAGHRLILARVPDRDASVLVVALDDDSERRRTLADQLLDRL